MWIIIIPSERLSETNNEASDLIEPPTGESGRSASAREKDYDTRKSITKKAYGDYKAAALVTKDQNITVNIS